MDNDQPRKKIVVHVRRDINQATGRNIMPNKPNPRHAKPKVKGPAQTPPNPNRKPRKSELLALEGKRFYSFAQSIEMMDEWCTLVKSMGEKPNEAFTEIIKADIQAIKDEKLANGQSI